MKRTICLIALLVCVLGVGIRAAEHSRSAQRDTKQLKPVQLVDPLIDTHKSRWFYFNSACRPFGMVNLSPDTDVKGTWNSGYLYGSKDIRCFSHIHAWQLSGIPVLPITGEMIGHQGMDAYKSPFSHDKETVRPGYHQVTLDRYGITAELTSTLRVGFHRYHLPKGKSAHVLFDTGALLAHQRMLRSEVRQVSDQEIEGYSLLDKTGRRRKPTYVYFVARFDRPMQDFGGWLKQGRQAPKAVLTGPIDRVSGRDAGAYVSFGAAGEKPLLMKVALSYTSVANARRNMQAELDHWDFDRVVRESQEIWNRRLSCIAIQGGSKAQRIKFYTDLWRSMLGRRIVSDVHGTYMDMTGDKGRIRQVPLDNGQPRFHMYNHDAWWGSHWTLNILWPLLCPDHYRNILNTGVTFYENGGLIPRGPSGGNYSWVMIGDSAVPAFAAALAKGIRGFDAEKAYAGLMKNARPGGSRDYGGYARDTKGVEATQWYLDKGYIPWGKPVKGGHGKGVTSLTLYSAYHDWCLAQMAQILGKTEDVPALLKRSQNYRNVIWSEKKFAWVRTPDGGWLENFEPVASEFEQKGFCESSASVATFYVPHDPLGLASLLGGPKAAAAHLDAIMAKAEPLRFLPGEAHGRGHASAWVEYSNQDSCGMAHYFNRIGFPWLSQKWVRRVHELVFSDTTPYGGYNGDEDQGQMGSLSALMALGLFQFDGGCAVRPTYEVTAPLFDKISIQLDTHTYGPDKSFTIVARNQAPENVYIQAARLNGKPLNQCWIYHQDLVQGGRLELELGPKPNKQWGVEQTL